MNFRTRMFSLVLACAFLLQACGTILYPERKGQIDGRIDVGVALLDGLGLLLFLVPGVIAFAVDFSTGAIYLPGGERAELAPEQQKELEAMMADSERKAEIDSWLQKEFSLNTPASHDDWVIRKI